MMRKFALMVLLATIAASVPLFAQSKAKAQNVPEIAFESVPNFLKFPPNIYLGNHDLGERPLTPL